LAHDETCIASVYTAHYHDQNGTQRASGIPLEREWSDRITYWHVVDLHEWAPDRAFPAIEREVVALISTLRG
jgi:hypothetical protein